MNEQELINILESLGYKTMVGFFQAFKDGVITIYECEKIRIYLKST